MRIPRYSLRSLLLGVLLLCVGIAALAYRANAKRSEQEAVETIWQMGGAVVFEGEQYSVIPLLDSSGEFFVPSMSNKKSAWRTWLDCAFDSRTPCQVLFNDDYKLHNVNDDDVDDLIEAISRIPSIKVIFLDGTRITNEGAQRLRNALSHCEIRNPRAHGASDRDVRTESHDR